MTPSAGAATLRVDGHALEARWIATDASDPARSDPAATLVFLHHGLGSVAAWRSFPDDVARASGHGALVYSRLGYGASDPAPLPRPVRFMHDEARLLAKLLDEAALRRVILVGHSDGASIALLHAATGDPRVVGVVSIAAHVFVEDVTVARIRERAQEYADTSTFRERLGRHHRDPDAAFHGWSGVWLHPDFRAWNIERDVERIAAPLLVIQGEADEYGTLAQVRSIAAHARGPVDTCILHGASHAPYVEQPDATRDAIAAFVRRIDGE